MKKLSLLVVLIFGALNPAHAEITNPDSMFKADWTCERYDSFLNEKISGDLQDCHTYARFLVENQILKEVNLLHAFRRLAGPKTKIGTTITTMLMVSSGQQYKAALAAEVAQRNMIFMMGSSGDRERGELYGEVLYRLGNAAQNETCLRVGKCIPQNTVHSIQSLMGNRFAYLDDVDPSSTLMCLLSVDAFLVPVRQVLASKRFNNCLIEVG